MDFNTQYTPLPWIAPAPAILHTGLDNYNSFVLTKCENGYKMKYQGKEYVAEHLSTIITIIRNLTEGESK